MPPRPGVDLQRAVYTSPWSDASAVYDAGGAPGVALFGHVRDNSHGLEVARLSVFDNVLKVLVKLLKTWPGPAVDVVAAPDYALTLSCFA